AYWHRKGEEGRYIFDADAPFGLPMRPSPFYVQVTLTMAGGEEVISGLAVRHRYEGNIFSGEKRTELLVVPALSVRMTPQIAIVPAAAIRSVAPPTPPPAARPAAGRGRGTGRSGASAPAAPPTTQQPGADSARGGAPPRPEQKSDARTPERELRVTLVNDTPAALDSEVHLEAPAGWTVTPARQSVKFTRSDESLTLRFHVTPAAGTEPGEYHVQAIATVGEQTFDRGYEVIEYPHIGRYHIYDPADAMLKVIDVRTPSNLTIGYIMGVGDQVPAAIEQLGAKVQMISPDDLAWGDLSRFDAIVTGVRAYERREDLRANNSRLLEYVFNGGTAIVQYNKFEFNEAQYGPYPAKVSADRVTDEHSPVQVVASRDPLMTTPNEINQATWANWVQERGLYFLGERDSRYHDVVELEENF